MSIGFPSFCGHPAVAVAAVRDAITRGFTPLASMLQGVRNPGLPLTPLLTTSRGESWYRPDSRQAQDALQMLLTPPDDLHPRLLTALLAIVVEHLRHLPHAAGQEANVLAAITAALGAGCTLEDASGSVPTADRDALWLRGPYRDGDPASDLLLNYLAFFQGQVMDVALKRRQYACTDYRQLPERFDQQQAALAERLGQVEMQASASEALVGYRQLNQWLYRQEWLVQVPLGVVQRFINVLLLRHCALTPLARQLIAFCRGQVSAQALSADWRTIGSQLKHASTPRELLDGISNALEKGPLALCALMYGLYGLRSMTLPLIPLSAVLGVVAEAGQQALSGRLRTYVGSPSLESTRFVLALNRLAGNCASLKYYAQPPLDSLEAWRNSTPAPPPGITLQVRNPQSWAGVRVHWARDLRPLPQDGTLPPAQDLLPRASEPPSPSVGSRPTGLLQAVRQVASGISRVAGGLIWRAPAVFEREVDLQALLYHQEPGAEYRPMIVTAQGQRALAGLGAVTVSGATVALLRAATRPGSANPMSTPGEAYSAPDFTELTPHGEAVLDALSHFHQKPDGTLTSTLLQLRVMLADPALAGDERAQWGRVMALLRKDFGPALPGLRDLVQYEADFAEFDVLVSAAVRHRRDVEARFVPPVDDEVMARQIIAWVQQTLVSARWQDRMMQLKVFGEWVGSHLSADHWLHTANPQEQALWLEYQQRLADSYQHLGRLGYDSLERLKAQRPALQKAQEDVDWNELQLAVLESKLRGELCDGGHVSGLQVMTAALNGEPQVTIASLQLSTGQGGDELTLNLPQWLVFVRRTTAGEEDGVVLYRAAQRRMQVFSTQRAMYQHPDLKRLRQSLQAEVQPPPTPAVPANRLATPPTLSLFSASRVPKPLPEVVLSAVAPGQRASWRHFFDEFGRQPHLWTSAHLQVVNADVNLRQSLQRRAGARLDREQARLQTLEDNPYLSLQEETLAQALQALGEFNDEYLPNLRTFTHGNATSWLTLTLRTDGILATNATVDADSLIITFNGLRMSFIDWVLEGYRTTADNVFAASNNFIRYATVEHHDPAVARALNQPQGRQGLQEYLRSTYPATAYIKSLERLLDPESLRGRRWRRLYEAVIKQGLQVALARAKAAGQLDHVPYTALKRLVDGLPDTTPGDASLHALHIGKVRIPEVLVLSREHGADYIYLDGPYGLELLKLTDYLRRANTPAYRDDLQARTLKRDETLVDNALRGAAGKTVHTVPITDFNREVILQWLEDQIDNVRQATTSRDQVRREQALKGLRFTVGAGCMAASAGIAAVACGAGVLGLAAYDVNSALRHLDRGQLNEAFGDVAFLWLDVFDVGVGLVALHKLLHWAGKAHFSGALELEAAVQGMVRHRISAFTPQGRINHVLARGDTILEPQAKLSSRPGKAQAGDFYAIDGQYFVMDTYQGEVRVFEVYSDNAWATIRVRDPQRPDGQGAPVHYREGHWRVDEGGLPGGGAGSSSLGAEDGSSLLGEGRRVSIFSSEEKWEAYLRLFRFDPDNRSNVDVIHALRSAIEKNQPLPQSSHEFLKNKADGWYAYGMFGQKPFDFASLQNRFDPDSLKQIAADFDFSDAPALGDWLLHDRLRQSGPHKADWPLWGLKYAREETVLNYYSPEDVLNDMKVFPSADVTRAYLREFHILEKDTRKRLLTDRINNRKVLLNEFPERVLVEAKVQELSQSDAFADAQAVRDYLAAFSFPADGDILKMALLKARINGGRTPAWAGNYLQLQSWKPYRSAMALTPKERRHALQQVLVSEGVCIDLKHAYDYLFKQFAALDDVDTPLWDLSEELVLAALLEGDRSPVWAIEHVSPGALMNIFRSEDIPANMPRLEIFFNAGSLEQSLLLPADMRRLSFLKIVSTSAVNTPLEVRLPINMPKLKELHVQGVTFQQRLSLDKMYELEKLHIINCNDEKVLRVSLPRLRLAQITNNAQMRELKVGRVDSLQTLDISSNPQLRELALDYSMDKLHTLSITANPNLQASKLTFPAAMRNLHALQLHANNLHDVSFLRHVQLPQLWRLDLSHNQLRSLTSMPRLPELAELQLEVNAFREIPSFVTDLTEPVKVNMIGNFMGDGTLRKFEAGMARERLDHAVVRFIKNADDPSSLYMRRLSDGVTIWFSEQEGEAVRTLWAGLEGEAYAGLFSTFLGQLYQSKRFDDVVSRQAMQGWLERLATHAELRRETFMVADNAGAGCDDWVSLVYNKMQEIDLRFKV